MNHLIPQGKGECTPRLCVSASEWLGAKAPQTLILPLSILRAIMRP
jgi:hypothetical protein